MKSNSESYIFLKEISFTIKMKNKEKTHKIILTHIINKSEKKYNSSHNSNNNLISNNSTE